MDVAASFFEGASARAEFLRHEGGEHAALLCGPEGEAVDSYGVPEAESSLWTWWLGLLAEACSRAGDFTLGFVLPHLEWIIDLLTDVPVGADDCRRE